jgi:TolB-like protein/Tfp pilus assembly protein PilF
MSNGADQPISSSIEPDTNGRLDSWKEIAAYLNREVRSVQRWEKEEDLPVRRHMHGRQGTVYAYKAELDVWLAQRQPVWKANGRATSGRLTHRLRLLAILAVLVVVVGYGARRLVWREPTKVMLAVLPFENLSGDPGQEYFSDGLTEEMIARLGGLRPDRLGVIAWTSARTYKDSPKTVEQIGQELGVDYLLEGSVRREGDRVRITAQLIQVSDQTHVWAETFQQQVSGILTVQQQVAQAVAREVRVSISPQSKTRRAQMKSVDPEAYEAYVRGRYEFNRWSRQGFNAAVGYFKQAVERDPDYALAYGWLALSYNALAFFEYLPPGQASPGARKASSRALEIDSNVLEAHLALAWARFAFNWEWSAAEREFQEALVANPSSSIAHWLYAWFLASMGRDDAARSQIRRALELDPFNPFVNTSLGDMLALWRRPEDALQQYRKTLDRVPEFPWPYHLMAGVYARQGRYDEAVAAERQYLDLSGQGSQEVQSLQEAYASSGGKGYWNWRLRRLSQKTRQYGKPPSAHLARVHAQLGETETAFEWLEKAYVERASSLILLNVDPAWDPLRDDPRFEDLVRRMNFPQSIHTARTSLK